MTGVRRENSEVQAAQEHGISIEREPNESNEESNTESNGEDSIKSAEKFNEEFNEESTFEQDVERTIHLLLSNTLNRPTLYRILNATAPGPLRLFDLEELVLALPEFKKATQPPYFLIEWLVETGALSFTEVDAEGLPITDERREGKTEDEIDDLIEDMIIETTEVGKEALRVFDPRQRLAALLQDHPDRLHTYLEVLEFLMEKHSYTEIDQLLRNRPVLMSGRAPDDRPMQPSVFVDKLAAAGGIIYDEGWIITPEGRAMLEGSKVEGSRAEGSTTGLNA
jgi:hypothetical protein